MMRDCRGNTRLLSILKEYEEADVNEGFAQARLRAVNDRADALYRQWDADRDNEELLARRRENLEECLRQADVAAVALRRKQVARKAITDTLTEAAFDECHWREDEDGNWETGCGLLVDGPIQNGQKFCGYCGANLVPVRFDEEADDAE